MVRIVAIMTALVGTAALAGERDCRCIFPETLQEEIYYSGRSENHLLRIGEKPLFEGLPEGVTQVMRFSFVHGHGRWFTMAKVETFADGTGRMVVDGANLPMPRSRYQAYERREVTLSADQIAKLDELAEQSTTFDYEAGTWAAGDIVISCQSLDMERMNADGYRYSFAWIGCSQPDNLMALINEVVRLGELEVIGRPGSMAFK